MDRRAFCAALLAGCSVGGPDEIPLLAHTAQAQPRVGMQTEIVFYRDPGTPLDLSHLGYPNDKFYNMGRTAASASGSLLYGQFIGQVKFAHWWCAFVPDGGSLELMVTTPGIHDEEQLARLDGPDNSTPIVRGAYITDKINAQILKGERFLLTRGTGRVKLYSAVLTLVW